MVAPLPVQPIPKSLAAPGLCAWIATAKYEDGLPLYRQETILARYGLTISRATLASWMIRLGELIVPLINLVEEVQLGYDVLQMDETTVQVLKEDGRAAQSESRMWVRRGGPPDKPVILFDYDPSRSGKVAWRLTEDFKGYLQSDGFSGYEAVGKREGVVHVGCLAHARRKFDEALKAQPAGNRGGLALEGLTLIQRIYRIEKAAREAKPHALSNASSCATSEARPVWDELRRWLDAKRGHAPPQMLIGKAMTYLDNQWPQLVARARRRPARGGQQSLRECAEAICSRQKGMVVLGHAGRRRGLRSPLRPRSRRPRRTAASLMPICAACSPICPRRRRSPRSRPCCRGTWPDRRRKASPPEPALRQAENDRCVC